MFTFNKPKFKVKTLKSGDKDFTFSPDGVILVSRAGFEISNDCPRQYMQIIQQCYQKGWLKPVANIKESEYMWEKLGE